MYVYISIYYIHVYTIIIIYNVSALAARPVRAARGPVARVPGADCFGHVLVLVLVLVLCPEEFHPSEIRICSGRTPNVQSLPYHAR